jgi:hypothetical protein
MSDEKISTIYVAPSYTFKPKPDISMFALAEVLAMLDIQVTAEVFNNLSIETKESFEMNE